MERPAASFPGSQDLRILFPYFTMQKLFPNARENMLIAVAYPSAPVSFFSPTFQVGQSYTVTFRSGISGESAAVDGVIASLRDLADGVYKPQLVVALPSLLVKRTVPA